MSERTRNDWGIIGRRIVAVLGCAVVTAVHVGSHSFAFMVPSGAPCKEAQIEIKQLSNAVDTYRLASPSRSLPVSLETLAEGPNPLIGEVPGDPWGNPYRYVYTRLDQPTGFVVYSTGPDGIAGTSDDILGEGR